MSEASSSARATPVDLTRSPPLPAPTTVSSRSLRPRRQRAGNSGPSSAVSSSRSRSQSHTGGSQPIHLDGAENTRGRTKVKPKRGRSESPVAGNSGRARKKRANNSDTTDASGSGVAPSAGVSGADESVSSIMSPASESMAGSSMLATPSPGLFVDDPAEVFQRMVEEHLAGSGSSGAPSNSDKTLPGAMEVVAESAEFRNILAPITQPSPVSSSLSDEESLATSSSGGKRPKRETEPPEAVPIQEGEPLAAYTCPICFSAPSHATITPCGHILCGECLFTAVKTSIQRGTYTLPHGEHMTARCPVCRAPIPGWDGKGGGVIGLKPRAVFSL